MGGTAGYILPIKSKQRVNAFQYNASCQWAVLLVCLPIGLPLQTHASIPIQFPLQASHINSDVISPNKKSEVPLQKFPLQNLSPILRPKDCRWSHVNAYCAPRCLGHSSQRLLANKKVSGKPPSRAELRTFSRRSRAEMIIAGGNSKIFWNFHPGSLGK